MFKKNKSIQSGQEKKETTAVLRSPGQTGLLTERQMAYEARRAAKAGVSLERWLKEKRSKMEMQAKFEAQAVHSGTKNPQSGLFARFLAYANKPFKESD